MIGGDLALLGAWQGAILASVLFHHSNVRFPERLERVMTLLIVTPRMHGIHHSDRIGETNSNWSSLLSVWDFLHRTFRLDVPQESITIGVPAYRRAHDVSIGEILIMPFRPQRDAWSQSSDIENQTAAPRN
jgi:sterol desaturase/sphingolipid hydroxylase (fatty acid hydroxylase superfamily)